MEGNIFGNAMVSKVKRPHVQNAMSSIHTTTTFLHLHPFGVCSFSNCLGFPQSFMIEEKVPWLFSPIESDHSLNMFGGVVGPLTRAHFTLCFSCWFPLPSEFDLDLWVIWTKDENQTGGGRLLNLFPSKRRGPDQSGPHSAKQHWLHNFYYPNSGRAFFLEFPGFTLLSNLWKQRPGSDLGDEKEKKSDSLGLLGDGHLVREEFSVKKERKDWLNEFWLGHSPCYTVTLRKSLW